MSRPHRPKPRTGIRIVALAFLAAFLLPQSPAMAVNRGNVADWADQYWNARPGGFPQFGDDCTNFTSQALWHGNIDMRWPDFGWTGSYNTDNYWGAQENPVEKYTTSWTVAHTQDSWVLGAFPNSMETVVLAKKAVADPPAGYRQRADLIYYDWDDNGSINHTSIIVGSGDDPHSSYNGTLVDQHTTDRKHAIWHLHPYNSQWPTTVYYPVFVPDGAN